MIVSIALGFFSELGDASVEVSSAPFEQARADDLECHQQALEAHCQCPDENCSAQDCPGCLVRCISHYPFTRPDQRLQLAHISSEEVAISTVTDAFIYQPPYLDGFRKPPKRV